MKLNLSKPASGYNLAAINDNFTKIEEEFQSKVLYRNNPVGEPNTLESDLDVNGHTLYNVGEIVLGGKNISAINSALIWRGTWSSATTYAISDAVYYNGSSYIAVAANTNSAPPSANWNVLAAQGATGAGTGDVVGPASSGTNNIALYASGTGKLLKDGGVTLALGGAVEAFLEASTATIARTAIGAAESGANASITSLTGLVAGGLPNSSVITPDIADNAITSAKVANANITAEKLSGSQTGNAPVFGVRAWCVFNGQTTGSNVPSSGGNVATVTRNGTGQYTVAFTTAMPDASYAFSGSANGTSPSNSAYVTLLFGASKTASSCQIEIINEAGDPQDATFVSLMFIR